MYGAADEKSAWHRVGTACVNSLPLALWLGFIRAYPAFLIVTLPSSAVPLITNPPPPAHFQAAVFSLQTALSQLSKPNRGLAGGGPNVVVQVKSPSCHPTLVCFENEWQPEESPGKLPKDHWVCLIWDRASKSLLLSDFQGNVKAFFFAEFFFSVKFTAGQLNPQC